MFHLKKVCPTQKANIVLTDEMKNYILANRSCRNFEQQAPVIREEINVYSREDNVLPEKFYQRIVEKHLGGTHKKLKGGVTDVTTETVHAEIKIWHRFKEALGQLIAYNIEDPKERLQVYLFGRTTEEMVEHITHVFSASNIECYTFTEKPGIISIVNLSTHESVYDHKIDRKRN